MTKPVCKPLLPVYDKPLIYYPLAILMQAGISEILIIVPPGEVGTFQALLGGGEQYGMRIQYAEQPVARGIADALLIGGEFLGGDDVCLVLGDNIFWALDLEQTLQRAARENRGGTVFGCRVDNPRPFGVVEFDEGYNVVSIEEKPSRPKSSYAVTGLYFYDGRVCEMARRVRPSARGELEITDLNRMYLDDKRLKVQQLGRGFAWFDTGTIDRLFSVGEYIRSVQEATGVKVAALEEIAYDAGWIRRAQLLKLADGLKKTEYGHYLEKIALSTRR